MDRCFYPTNGIHRRNLFGEGIQLHQKELLKDLSVSRPTFIRYDWAISYLFEAFVFLLFAAGVSTADTPV